jgi:VanZ family protein
LTLSQASCSLAIEVLQFALPTGRHASVTDVILNSFGRALGCTLMLALRGLTPARTPRPIVG